jgi:hypothetical protein
VESATAIQTPFNEAMLFASLTGLALGALVAIMSIGTAFVQKRLHIKDDEVLKHFLVAVAFSGFVSLTFYVVGFRLWDQEIAARREMFNENLEVLGYILFGAFTAIGMMVASFLESALLSRLTKAMSEKNEATD